MIQSNLLQIEFDNEHSLYLFCMSFQFSVSQCPKLDALNCQTLRLTFTDTLQHVQHSLHPIIADLKDKQLLKCYLLPQQILPKPKYEGVLLGGTFDYFHLGHQLLLLTAILEASKRILVGVTGQKLLIKKKNKQIIQSVEIRKKEIEKYIKMIKPQLIVEVVQINDPFGPAIDREDFDAIAVSMETLPGAHKINQIRRQKGLKQLQIEICPLMSESNKIEVKTSSSDIRQYILKKNKMKIEDFVVYKNKWLKLNTLLAKYLEVQEHQNYADMWWNRILVQYSQYWRHYHTNFHIFSLLQHLQHEQNVSKLSQVQYLVLVVGIWFHDIQYVPISKQNQQISADIAVDYLKGFASKAKDKLQDLAKRCKNAILATKTHKGASLEEKILIDLDLSVLDSSHNQYTKYAEQIRLQYLPVVKAEYNKKRSQFLKSMKLQEVFYFRKPAQLIENVKWQLQMLKEKNQQL